MEKKTYTKLSDLVNNEFTVEEAYGYQWKRWNPEIKRFEISEQFNKDFKKTYSIKTDKGVLDLGSGQLSTLLEATYYKGKADIVGKRFEVKSNGKTGMDIRYFFNLKKTIKPENQPLTQKEVFDTVLEDIDETETISISDIPF